jgi:hypothetical protein
MPKISAKQNKNPYQQTREALGLTRESASELLEWISKERIERIENEKIIPEPDEVVQMADRYKNPDLCNYYCANQCGIGRLCVKEIKSKELAKIILEMLASLNAMNKNKDRLIEITADGEIGDDEIKDFIYIQKELDRISMTVDALQLWSKRMLASGAIDSEKYNKLMGE